jgi:glutaredoxin-related protein
MLKIYGSMHCPDCVCCCEDLKKSGVAFEYLDFNEDLRNLKAFLALRDREEVFLAVKERGQIGIPCILREDGSVTLDWAEFM